MYGDDDTHITGQIPFAQIAEAIRHKKYGLDMREAIAQGFEQFIGILQQVSDLESEYSDLQSKYNDIIGRLNDDENKISDLQSDIKALSQRCDNIEEKHDENIKAMQEQLERINHAIFGYGEFEVNYQKPTKQRPDDYEVNYNKPLNNRQPTHEHNFIEIETEQDHKKEKGL